MKYFALRRDVIKFLHKAFCMDQLNDRLYRIIGIPLVALVANIIYYYDMNEKHGFSFRVDYLYTIVITFLLWEVVRRVIIYSRSRYSSYKDSKKRIVWTTMASVIVTTSIMTLISAFYDVTNWWGYEYKLKNYLYNNFAALTYVVIIAGIYESIYYFKKWRDIAVETEILKKESLQSQLDSLKQQISPHFLFNTLNTLSSLIRKDVGRAELFLDELSKVYRYLLQNNEGSLIALDVELQFVQSYFHLLTTRYGNSLQLKVNVAERYKNHLIAPLTLQLLIENAVKHNSIDKSTPLIIALEITHEGNLIVSNNLQRKVLNLPSHKVGLANIAAKYRLLGQPGVVIAESEKSFSVQIPLIKKLTYEPANR